MEIVDANIVLRYLLNDNESLAEQAKKIFENNNIFLPFEVCAEVVYVLNKVYGVPREDIKSALVLLLDCPNISTIDKSVIKESLGIYLKENIDFVDSILVAYNRIKGAAIHSFDKRVNMLCK